MSRIWDVDGIEWEDLPTVSDLLCAADTKILAPEVALRYGGKPDDRGRVDNERDLKRARRKIKKLRKIDPEPSDKIVLLPKHVINRRNADHGFGYYDVEPCAFTRGGAQKLGEDACAEVYPWDLFLLNEEPTSVVLGYRVWLGGEWDLCERYRFLAVVCASALHRIREQKELRKQRKAAQLRFANGAVNCYKNSKPKAAQLRFMTIECLRSVHSIVYRKIFRRYNKYDI